MNVVPAVWPGLFELFALKAGSAIRAIAACFPPLPSLSRASSMPPFSPISRSASWSRLVFSRKKGGTQTGAGRCGTRQPRGGRGYEESSPTEPA
jgi:hypothetical protein